MNERRRAVRADRQVKVRSIMVYIYEATQQTTVEDRPQKLARQTAERHFSRAHGCEKLFAPFLNWPRHAWVPPFKEPSISRCV